MDQDVYARRIPPGPARPWRGAGRRRSGRPGRLVARVRPATSARRPAFRPTRKRRTPSSARASAMAEPMPPLAPVIRATPSFGIIPRPPAADPTSSSASRGLLDGLEGHARALGDVEQAVLAVGEVEHPEQRQLALAAAVVAADRPVEARGGRAAARTWDSGSGSAGSPRARPSPRGRCASEPARALGPDEVEVVGRGVVLGVAAVRRARERADRRG